MEALRDAPEDGARLVGERALNLLRALSQALNEPADRPADRLVRGVSSLAGGDGVSRAELRGLPDVDDGRPTLWASGARTPASDGERACIKAEVISLGECIGTLEVYVAGWLDDPQAEQRVVELAASLFSDALRAHREICGSAPLKQRLDRYERAILTDAMRRARGVQSRAARALRTTPRILSYRLKRQGLHAEFKASRRSGS